MAVDTSVPRDPCILVERFSRVKGVRAVVVSIDGLPLCWRGDSGVVEALAAIGSGALRVGEREAGSIVGSLRAGVAAGNGVVASVRLGDGIVLSMLIDGEGAYYTALAVLRIGTGIHCPKCGYELSMAVVPCPECESPIPFTAPVCPSCKGVVAVKRCPGCGARVDLEGRLHRRLGLF